MCKVLGSNPRTTKKAKKEGRKKIAGTLNSDSFSEDSTCTLADLLMVNDGTIFPASVSVCLSVTRTLSAAREVADTRFHAYVTM